MTPNICQNNLSQFMKNYLWYICACPSLIATRTGWSSKILASVCLREDKRKSSWWECCQLASQGPVPTLIVLLVTWSKGAAESWSGMQGFLSRKITSHLAANEGNLAPPSLTNKVPLLCLFPVPYKGKVANLRTGGASWLLSTQCLSLISIQAWPVQCSVSSMSRHALFSLC